MIWFLKTIGPRISGSCRETHADGTLCENWKKEPA